MKQHLVFFVFLLAVALIAGCADEAATPPAEVPVQSDGALQEEEGYDADAVSLGKFFGPAKYEITLQNLTPATGPGASQPFSPLVVAVHSRRTSIYKLWHRASDELRQVAEDAVNGPLVNKLNSSSEVLSVTQGTGVIFPGGSETFTVTAEHGFHRLSIVSMLVNTNDAITGVSRRLLPLFGTREIYLWAFDAGTERNTEMKAHIPGPCCGNPLVRVPTNERIRFHRGITGVGDLDADIYGWHGPVGKLTIKRVY
jgi:hypothetical protein